MSKSVFIPGDHRENAKRLIVALRSMKFPQGQGWLCTLYPETLKPEGYCCIGVAMTLAGEQFTRVIQDGTSQHPPRILFEARNVEDVAGVFAIYAPKDWWAEHFGDLSQQDLAHHNDNDMSKKFDAVIAFIRGWHRITISEAMPYVDLD